MKENSSVFKKGYCFVYHINAPITKYPVQFCKYIYIFIRVARQLLPLYSSTNPLTNLGSIFFLNKFLYINMILEI